jgi:glycosyltransferase involved in cell wall biosynthesis
MKVLLATPLYPPDSGGPATDAALLYRELPKQGIEVAVCSFGSVRHLPRGIRHVRYAYELYKHSRQNIAGSIDVIVAMDTFSVCLPAMIVARLMHKKFVVRVPGDFAWEQATQRFGVTDTIEVFQTKRYGWKVELIRSLQKFAVRRADLIVTISHFLESIVLQWGVPSNRLTLTYLGMDFTEKVVMPREVPAGKILFTLGRFVPWKGFSMLIELMPELPHDWHLVVVGDGPFRQSLEEKARVLDVASRITFTGVIARAEVLGWYRRADVFVLNTAQENFSFQVLEAMAASKPIITTTVGSLPELITDGIDGVLCLPNDREAFKEAILSTQRESELWHQRAENAEKKAKRLFSADAAGRAFAEALKTL